MKNNLTLKLDNSNLKLRELSEKLNQERFNHNGIWAVELSYAIAVCNEVFQCGLEEGRLQQSVIEKTL